MQIIIIKSKHVSSVGLCSSLCGPIHANARLSGGEIVGPNVAHDLCHVLYNCLVLHLDVLLLHPRDDVGLNLTAPALALALASDLACYATLLEPC